MKRIVAWVVMTVMTAGLAGCQTVTPPERPDPDITTAQPTAAPTAVQPATHYDWAEDLPRMDGSTSTIPLEAGIRAALFGISQQEAELQVKHSTTYGSFYNLVDGNCDLIFSVPLSEGQIAEAKEKGKTLEMEKIAAEGFVFVVNAQNPVDTLTRQQLKDIYSGKITNWKEVGGNDAPIVAYQRNETSGSQNFMHTFMGDTPLMKPVTEFLPSSMGALMDAIAVYDNAENAIGYSVYAYAADMYGNGNEIKFIQVDGVAPTKATMAAGDYPLLGYNYAVYDAAAPADSSLRKLVAWLVTEEGQRAVQGAGYIPLMPLGDIPETVIDLYTAVGTGPEKPADYLPSPVWNRAYEWNVLENGLVACLRDKSMQDTVNGFIETASAETGAVSSYVRCECINGYLSVAVNVELPGGEIHLHTAIYDLVAGKQIPYSDLFFKGEEYVSALNTAVQNAFNLQNPNDDPSAAEDVYPLKRPFAGLEAGHDAFSLTAVLYGSNNLYTDRYLSAPVLGVYSRSVLSVPRDLTEVFEEGKIPAPELAIEDVYGTYRWLEDGGSTELLSEATYPGDLCRRVNEQINEICRAEMSAKALGKRYGDPDWDLMAEGLEVWLNSWADRWLVLKGHCYSPFFSNGSNVSMADILHIFDRTTGEEIPYTDLLMEGWQAAAVWYGTEDSEMVCFRLEEVWELEPLPAAEEDLTGYTLFDMQVREDGAIALSFDRGVPSLEYRIAVVPAAYFIR